METIQKIENFFIKVEKFFSNLNYIQKITGACNSGIKAFNDHLIKGKVYERDGEAK